MTNIIKKFLMVMGAIFLCLIMIAAVISIVGVYYGYKFEKSGSAFTDEAINTICSSWEPQDWYDRSDPEYFDDELKSKIRSLFALYARSLGKIKKNEGSNGKAKMKWIDGKIIVTANFVAYATFEKGDGEIKAELTRHDGQWELVSLHITSKELKLE